ncbi:MAG: thermonuclease family protein [Ruthenibacterium sp.]
MKRLLLIFFVALAVLLLGATQKDEQPKTKKITAIFITDGDTFLGRGDSQAYRLFGVDAPELGQPWGNVAKSALIELIHKKRLTATVISESYGREVVEVKHGDKDIGLELIKMGLAWHAPKYAPDRQDYAEAQTEAKTAKRGLWGDDKPISPEDWRKQKKESK